MSEHNEAFWRTKSLDEMDDREWEALCDGCGQCCLVKLEDEDTNELLHTKLACKLLDIGKCRCTDYANRHDRVSDCAVVSPETVRTLDWLPHSCAYRLIAEGKDLFWWHPLVSGNANTVHEAGVSVRDWAESEEGVPVHKMERFVVRNPAIRKVLTGE